MAQVHETYLDAVFSHDYDPRDRLRASADVRPAPPLTINATNATVSTPLDRPIVRIAKRGFDIVASAVLLTLLSPLMVMIGFAVRQGGGAALYASPRIGHGGRHFTCYKFRTMVVGADQLIERILATDPAARRQWAINFKLPNDPRITPIGAMLRRTSLDELPQLINVLKGEMSLIGPRPIIETEIGAYGPDFAGYAAVRPGLTGLWQVSGRSNVSFAGRVALDQRYIRHWSPWQDAQILFRTVFVVLNRSGAY